MNAKKFGYVNIVKRNLMKKANAYITKKNALQNIAMTLIIFLAIDAEEKGIILPHVMQQHILKDIT
jgi:hypothetical protein